MRPSRLNYGREMPWPGHERLRTEDIGTVAMEALERVEEKEPES
jgi:hypothetical protein